VTPGVIEGGWGFVWAAYVVTWAGLALYGIYLYRQRHLAEDEVRAIGEEDDK
jgi:hypothetical protein